MLLSQNVHEFMLLSQNLHEFMLLSQSLKALNLHEYMLLSQNETREVIRNQPIVSYQFIALVHLSFASTSTLVF